MRVFAYIARDFESAAEATSLLSSVASLTISKALRLVLRKFSSTYPAERIVRRMKRGKICSRNPSYLGEIRLIPKVLSLVLQIQGRHLFSFFLEFNFRPFVSWLKFNFVNLVI